MSGVYCDFTITNVMGRGLGLVIGVQRRAEERKQVQYVSLSALGTLYFRVVLLFNFYIQGAS